MVQKTSNDSILRYSHCGICTLLHYKFPHPYFFDSATHLLLPLIFYALMCPCLKLGPTFAAKEGFDDEMPPHVIADFTKFRLSRDPPPEDKLDSLRREFVTILDSIDLKSTYKSIHNPRKSVNDVFIKTIY